MCPPCAALNWEKRHQTADLRGRHALVTGARVKIGYQAAIKLLRAGAHVVVLTRFPHDAARRYAAQTDFADFAARLTIHGIDLRHTPSVEALAEHLSKTLPRLDYLVNNACQTVRRPAGFYAHLIGGEAEESVSPEMRPLLVSHEALRHGVLGASSRLGSGPGHARPSAAPSEAALLPEDIGRDLALFPEGQLDADLQQVDLRDRNSWRLLLHEVPTVELLEVHLVNAVAPYVLNGRLRALMKRSSERDKHIVNVSAMEGQFYREWKTSRHPHTNMAKAALNMMTRTSAEDYLEDGIHMNSVDTGWVTDEDPAAIAERKTAVHGFHPPLDIVDGAARILDPIFSGANTGEHLWGLFLKDYRPSPW
jgi:NAD(P)-dependent dehydrogenase (short-subunit alcohol dehydrogenase family)